MPVPPGFTRPPCKLIGEDGNVFNVIGRVKRALSRAGHPDLATQWVEEATSKHSYDEVLGLAMDYVDVE